MQMFFSSLTRNQKTTFLIIIILAEAVVGRYVWIKSVPRATFGFLIKNGESYVVAWRTEGDDYQSQSYGSLKDALSFANRDLKLKTGRNPIFGDELERVWISDRRGAYVVFWKTLKIDFLNQLTFHKQADADFFFDAFRRGDYTPSPFGHSIFMRPVSAY